jgi:hypothetical protein
MEWADKYLNTSDTITKVVNYYLGLTGDKNIVYYPLQKGNIQTYFRCLQTAIWNSR